MSDALNAFVDLDPNAREGTGPLADLTIGVKANIAVRGLPWTAGMLLHRERVAQHDAEVVARLRGTGAKILGTLNMHEAALGATTDNPWFGRTQNAHRLGYTPGGSSGGSGAAVAAGLCDAALGTDTMGSVRIPASYNGVYGLKPTQGAVSQDELTMLMPGFDCIGPLARDLDVLDRVWQTIRRGEAGPRIKSGATELVRVSETEDPSPRPPSRGPASSSYLTLVDVALVDVQPAVRRAYERIVRAIGGAREIALPHAPPAVRMAGFVECVRYLIGELGDARVAQHDLLSPELHFMLDYGERQTPRPEILAETKQALIETLGSDGVLVMPTAPQAAFPHTNRPPANQSDFTCMASVAGLPALAIPAGTDDDGMPVGVQLVGPASSESKLIALARTLEGALP